MCNPLNINTMNMPTRIKRYCPLFFILVMTCIVYYPLSENDFLYYWDDQWCVINPYTSGGLTWENIYRIFTETHGGQYSPLNEIGYVLIYSLFGYSPVIFHLAGLGVHLLNVVLLYFFLSGLLTQSSRLATMNNKQIVFLATLLWAIHPVNVEPVAWISASKVLVYTSFYLTGLLCYLKFIRTEKLSYYVATLALTLCSCLGKEQAVVFPLCLLLVDFVTDRGLLRLKIWEEKLPFLLLSLYMGTIPMLAQGFRREELDYPLIDRVVFAAYSLIAYLTKCLIPIKLSYLYPFPMLPGYAMPFRFWFYPVVVIFVVYCIYLLRQRRIILFTSLFFLIHLLFVLHIIPISRFAIVADRYLYLPGVASCLLMAYLFVTIMHLKEKRVRRMMIVSLIIYSCYLGCYTNYYVRQWQNSDSIKKELRELINEREDIKNMQELQQLMRDQ